MREIKFRAWNKIWKMMSMVDKIEFEDGNPYSVSTTIEATDFDHTDEWSDYEVGDEIILQQFTGLKDKNGKEIYEGDIVKCRKMNKVGDGLLYGIQLAIQDTFIVEYKFCGFNPFNGWVENDDLEWEIIGNIFENPELISLDK